MMNTSKSLTDVDSAALGRGAAANCQHGTNTDRLHTHNLDRHKNAAISRLSREVA